MQKHLAVTTTFGALMGTFLDQELISYRYSSLSSPSSSASSWGKTLQKA